MNPRPERREAIFHDDRDRRLFLTTLGEACEKTGGNSTPWIADRLHLGQRDVCDQGQGKLKGEYR